VSQADRGDVRIMRVHILRALLNKEFHRHVANRGGIALGLLLVIAAVLLAMFNPNGSGATAGGDGMAIVGGVHHCYVEYDRASPFVRSLEKNVSPELFKKVVFRERTQGSIRGLVSYEPGSGAMIIRHGTNPKTGQPTISVFVWHPQDDKTAMAPYEAWFWKEARRAMQIQAEAIVGKELPGPDFNSDDLWAIRESFQSLNEKVGGKLPEVTIERAALGAKPLDLRSAVATGMVVFALYFTCVYLLPTLNCEERERGTLLSQALSPASPQEIVAAKFLFYPTAGILLAAILAGIYKPAILLIPFFWLALLAVASAFLGIGMTIATLAKTQRAAFLGSMCYLISVSLILFICSANGIPYLSGLAIEFHGPRILHAAVAGPVEPHHWLHLLATFGLGCCWIGTATWLFRRRGWQ
ncbi:MAG: ABC transporter permease, partial [Gemmataceae bacterium]